MSKTYVIDDAESVKNKIEPKKILLTFCILLTLKNLNIFALLSFEFFVFRI